MKHQLLKDRPDSLIFLVRNFKRIALSRSVIENGKFLIAQREDSTLMQLRGLSLFCAGYCRTSITGRLCPTHTFLHQKIQA